MFEASGLCKIHGDMQQIPTVGICFGKHFLSLNGAFECMNRMNLCSNLLASCACHVLECRKVLQELGREKVFSASSDNYILDRRSLEKFIKGDNAFFCRDWRPF